MSISGTLAQAAEHFSPWIFSRKIAADNSHGYGLWCLAGVWGELSKGWEKFPEIIKERGVRSIVPPTKFIPWVCFHLAEWEQSMYSLEPCKQSIPSLVSGTLLSHSHNVVHECYTYLQYSTVRRCCMQYGLVFHISTWPQWQSRVSLYRVGQLKWGQLTFLMVTFECVGKIQ